MKLQLYKLDLENTLVQAESTYRKDLKELSFFLGGGEYEPVDVKDTLTDLDIEELVDKAMQRRESIKALQEQIESVDYQIRPLELTKFQTSQLGLNTMLLVLNTNQV